MKKLLLVAVLVLLPAAWFSANAQTAEELALKVAPDEHVLGKEDAPITIIEYMSMTCPHCAHFHLGVLPELKEDYIDTGKVRFVIRDLPWDAVAFAVSKVTHCAGEGYHAMLDLFMNTQKGWAHAQDPLAEIKKVARMGGMSGTDVDACLLNEEVHTKVNHYRTTALDVLNVRGTPTLFINGEKMSGAPEMDEISGELDKLLAK